MNQEQIIEAVEKMTVIELNTLVKAIEEKWGVSAAAVAAAPAAGGAAAGEVRPGRGNHEWTPIHTNASQLAWPVCIRVNSCPFVVNPFFPPWNPRSSSCTRRPR